MSKKIDQSIEDVINNYHIKKDDKYQSFETASKQFEELINEGFATRRGNNLISVDERTVYLFAKEQYQR